MKIKERSKDRGRRGDGSKRGQRVRSTYFSFSLERFSLEGRGDFGPPKLERSPDMTRFCDKLKDINRKRLKKMDKNDVQGRWGGLSWAGPPSPWSS